MKGKTLITGLWRDTTSDLLLDVQPHPYSLPCYIKRTHAFPFWHWTIIVKCGNTKYPNIYIQRYTHTHMHLSLWIIYALNKTLVFCTDLSAADVSVTKLHTLYCERWNIAYCRVGMPTAGGNKWVKDVAFVDSVLLIKAVWDNESSPPLKHALH